MARKSVTTVDAEIASRLRAARLASGLTQMDVEWLTGKELTQTCISNYENGLRRVPITSLLTLADLYGFSAAALLPSVR